jgi:hypothetical protein
MTADERWFLEEFDTVGLCRTCAHARIVASARGSTFYLCRLSETDARFPKYPPLPITKCPGYMLTASENSER